MRAGLKLLVVEKNPMSGGQVLNTYEVDNYLGMPGFNGFDMGMFRACRPGRRCISFPLFYEFISLLVEKQWVNMLYCYCKYYISRTDPSLPHSLRHPRHNSGSGRHGNFPVPGPVLPEFTGRKAMGKYAILLL